MDIPALVIFLICSAILIIVTVVLIMRWHRRRQDSFIIDDLYGNIPGSSKEDELPRIEKSSLKGDELEQQRVMPPSKESFDDSSSSIGAKTMILRPPLKPYYPVRLDVAGPHYAILNKWFNAAACVKTPTSPALRQDGLQNIVSKMGNILDFDPNSGVKLKIEILPSSDFDFQPTCFTFFLHQNLDSEIFFFSICPRKTGTARIVFCLSQADEEFAIASEPLSVRVKMAIEINHDAQPPALQGLTFGIAQLQQPLSLSEDESRIRIDMLNILDQKLILSDLKELLFNLGLDLENYPGTTRREKIIEIILHFIRLGKINLLTKAITNMRPDLTSNIGYLRD